MTKKTKKEIVNTNRMSGAGTTATTKSQNGLSLQNDWSDDVIYGIFLASSSTSWKVKNDVAKAGLLTTTSSPVVEPEPAAAAAAAAAASNDAVR